MDAKVQIKIFIFEGFMENSYKYTVAGHTFCISLPQGFDKDTHLSPYAPFEDQTTDSKPIINLRVEIVKSIRECACGQVKDVFNDEAPYFWLFERGEMDSPLSEPPKQEPEKNTMQPTLEGDQPVREQKQAQETRENNLVQEKAAQEEIPGTKKAAPEKNDKKAQFFIDGVELTEETEKQFPEHIVKAFKLIQQLIDEMEAVKQANQQHTLQLVKLATKFVLVA